MASIINATTTNGVAISADNSGILQLATNSGATAVTIDASQNVGIGTSIPIAGTKLIVNGGYTAFQFNSGTGPNYPTYNSYYGAIGTNFQSGGSYLDFWNNVGSGFQWHIQSGASTQTSVLTIDATGNLLVGYTSSNGAYKLQVNSQIFATSSTIATSDGRYKKDIQSLDSALGLVNQLNPVQFSWKQHPVHAFDTSTPTIGFIAQEVQQVLADKPYLSSIIKSSKCVIKPEEKDDDGNMTKEAVTEEFLGIAEGSMIALLTKAIQELKAIIDTQQTRITALEAK